MRDELEYIQKRASKIAFGWDSSYDELVSDGRVVMLEERRRRMTTNFAKKAEQNPNFKHWFKEKVYNVLT